MANTFIPLVQFHLPALAVGYFIANCWTPLQNACCCEDFYTGTGVFVSGDVLRRVRNVLPSSSFPGIVLQNERCREVGLCTAVPSLCHDFITRMLIKASGWEWKLFYHEGYHTYLQQSYQDLDEGFGKVRLSGGLSPS